MKHLRLLSICLLFATSNLFAQNSLDLLLKNTNAGTHTNSAQRSIVNAGNTANSAKTSNIKPDSVSRWAYGGNFKISLSQASFSNWASGGENSAAGTITTDFAFNYLKDKLSWNNYVYATYGQIFKTDINTKLDDMFEITSKLNEQLSNNLYMSQAVTLKSQFADGYNYTSKDTVRVSQFFAPAYMYVKVGIDYKPKKNFSISFSPLMGKGTFVASNDQSIRKRYGMDEDGFDEEENPIYKKSKYEFGGGITLNASNVVLAENVKFTTVFDLFSNYLNKPQNMNIDWRFNLSFDVNQYITTDIGLRAIYDPNIVVEEKGPQLQFMQTLSIGFVYKLDQGKIFGERQNRKKEKNKNLIAPVD